MTSRTQVTRVDGEISLNLNEYIFLRKVAIAWNQCSAQSGLMAKSQIDTCAANIILTRTTRFSENQHHAFNKVLQEFSRADECQSDSYRFLAVLSIFHKFEMFQRMKQNNAASGTLNYRELEQAATDSEGPSQKLSIGVVDVIFKKYLKNLEFSGIDFREFFLLMTSIDNIYIYGKEKNGSMTLKEWQTFAADKLIRPDILDNIDDCYIDKAEKDEKLPHTNHWSRQQEILEKSRRRRFMKVKQFFFEKKLPDNEDARKFAFQIYDLDQDNAMNAGEMFLFFKFAFLFKQFTTSNVHLVFQRNLDFHLESQLGQFTLGLFKEEKYRFEEL